MKKEYFAIDYRNEFAECDETRYVHGTREAAESYADDTVTEYGEQFEYLIQSDDPDDIDDYYANCVADVREATEEEIREEDFEEI